MGKIKESRRKSTMKILHIGLMVNGRNEGLSAAFRKRCNDFEFYRELGVSKNLPEQVNSLNFIPNLVFLQIQSGEIDGVDTVNLLFNTMVSLKEKGAYIINWSGDMRGNTPEWMIRMNQYVGITSFSNERDNRNVKGKFLQIGFDPEVFKHWESSEPYHDVVFMGNNYGNQFPLGMYRRQAVDRLAKYDSGIYGNYKGAIRALNPDPNNPFPIQSQESKIYNNCKIAISISHYNEDRYTSDRLFRGMGSGAFILSHHFIGIEKDFEIGKHLDTFKSLDEMEEKIKFYLSNPKERQTIADNGYEYAHSNFTYDNMVDNIIKVYEDR